MTEQEAKARAQAFADEIGAPLIWDTEEDREEIGTIGDLQPGQAGYTLRWAFSPSYPVFRGNVAGNSAAIGRGLDGTLWTDSADVAKALGIGHRGKHGYVRSDGGRGPALVAIGDDGIEHDLEGSWFMVIVVTILLTLTFGVPLALVLKACITWGC